MKSFFVVFDPVHYIKTRITINFLVLLKELLRLIHSFRFSEQLRDHVLEKIVTGIKKKKIEYPLQKEIAVKPVVYHYTYH